MTFWNHFLSIPRPRLGIDALETLYCDLKNSGASQNPTENPKKEPDFWTWI